jgi:hypothetical protein
MAEPMLEPEPELEVRTDCELPEENISLLVSSDGLELLLDANGGLGRRNSPCRALRIASLWMLSIGAASSSDALELHRSRGLDGLDLAGFVFLGSYLLS